MRVRPPLHQHKAGNAATGAQIEGAKFAVRTTDAGRRERVSESPCVVYVTLQRSGAEIAKCPRLGEGFGYTGGYPGQLFSVDTDGGNVLRHAGASTTRRYGSSPSDWLTMPGSVPAVS